MKGINLLLILLCLFSFNNQAQQAKDYAVQVQAVISESEKTILLKWPLDANASGYKIFRKQKFDLTWGTIIKTLSGNTTNYLDTTIEVGKGYEYYVQRTHTGASRLAHGYLYGGIKLPAIQSTRILLLLIDQNYVNPLATEIEVLKLDLIKDGWIVDAVSVNRNATPVQVKSIITSRLAGIPENPQVTTVFLLGKISVPYSGGFVAEPGKIYPPDGHTDHGGAWPTDMYYGSLNESIWTDNIVNDNTPARNANRNVIGDGKFDLMLIENERLSLEVGRVDLSNMPAFGISDTALMKQYLLKNHAYKNAQFPIIRRGLIDDNFGAMSGEAFAASAWRDFATLFGDSVRAGDYLTETKKGNYLFTYGCGSGSYTNCAGVASTSQFNNDSINQIFTALFGSYFGDWDSQNNLLRAPLASKNGGLASVWSGRPHWHFHHMALGEHIGFSTKLTQNNFMDLTLSEPIGYVHNTAPTFISINLMGDPTLRLHMRQPLPMVNANSSTDNLVNTITWQPIEGAVGYQVSKSTGLYRHFKSSIMLADTITSWVDNTPYAGYTTYLVRPVFLEQTPSGSYYNLGLGAIDSAFSTSTVGIINKVVEPLSVQLFPNPASEKFTVWIAETNNISVELYDISGKILIKQQSLTNSLELIVSGIAEGLYIVKVYANGKQSVKKVLIK